MGRFVPDDDVLPSLKNDAERLVVEALRHQLSDDWLVLPDVSLGGDRVWQMDVVIAHPRDGIAVIEVKGHRPQVRQGRFVVDGQPMQPSPVAQARENMFELRRRVRARRHELKQLDLEWAIAFPNVSAVQGELPDGMDRAQLFTNAEILSLADAVDELMTRRWRPNGGQSAVDALLEVARPDAEVSWESEARARLARARLEATCAEQVRALESLDLNPRVAVTGGAGSGKTRLAIAWARRAVLRGERTLLTCFNLPLAERLRESFSETSTVMVGNVFEVGRSLPGIPEIEEPEGADARWWEGTLIEHLRAHWAEVAHSFDTIVVDEAQDFDPAWIDLLERLLPADGSGRLLLVADLGQVLFERGFRLPEPGDGWARCELVANCRNTFQIARLLRRFGGAAPIGGPESEDLRWIEADSMDAAIEAVGDAIDRILDEYDHQAASVLVLTVASHVRDRLREQFGFVAWEERSELAIVCENVQRMKGMEFDHVVLVVPDGDVEDRLLYVGAGRAVMSLTVIGPRAVAQRIGLIDERDDAAAPQPA